MQGINRYKRVMLILGSGCSRHMTGDRALLSNMVEKAGPIVTFGDDNKGFTTGYGNLEIGNVTIENISLVEGLKHNLLSISQFCDKGFDVSFRKERFLISNRKDEKLALQGVRKGNLFIADLDSASKDVMSCFYSKASAEDSWLWNKKLSHLNFKTMNSLVKRELVRGLPQMEFCKEGLCEACEKGKSKKASHRSKDMTNISEPLQLIHMDLFGPVNVMSVSRKRFALVMMDDYSKYTWVLFLHSKDETPQLIINHVKKIELEENLHVRLIRSDNGTEFKNSVLNDFCTDKGISRQFSAPRTPQQNGVVERKNRTLIEAARTMLSESILPMYFWAEAVNTACYTQNRTLITKEHEKTPYEIMANKNPTLKYFHVFGGKCYVLRDDEHLGKFEDKASEGIFLGYSLESKAFRVNVIEDKKVVESLNVTFVDYKLPSLQTEDSTETLEFKNMSGSEFNSDLDEPEAVIGNNGTGGDEPGTGGENHSSTIQEYTTSDSISHGERSSSHPSSSSGGADQGSTSHTQQNERRQEESSRCNLPRQTVWSRDHPWELIVGDPQAGV